jgi:hypothetical protein
MLATWLYVSTSLLEADAHAETAKIRSKAEIRNPKLSLTGALLFSGGHFAQFLEGPEAMLAEMKHAICADGRHKDVITLKAGESEHRRYPRWWLAYSGRATAIEKILSRSARDNDARELMLVMDEFVRGLH